MISRVVYTKQTIGVRMSLTTEDLQKIDKLVTGVVSGATSGLATKSEMQEAMSRLATKAELQEAVSELATKTDLDRMEGRLTTSIGLLQRDTFDRLDQHEQRIGRLEKSLTK